MADKSIDELIAATSVTPTDLFVLEQNGTAKKLTGQILENWLVSFADGHGGIQSIAKLSTSGLADTYRITMADTTIFDFVVNNGKGISSIMKTATSGLVDTYTIDYNDGTSTTFTVANGAKGDPGDTAYLHIKFASQEPTESSHSFGDIPDAWIGIYWGFSETAPTDWTEYKWYQIKGGQGDTGDPATLISASVTYQASDSGTIIPSGVWSESIPVVAQSKYLWTRKVTQFNTGNPITEYTISRMGLDGLGSVVSVCNVSPDENGNVPLTAKNVGALPSTGGDMTGPINMNGQPLRGLNEPTEDTDAVPKSYADKMLPKAGGTMTGNLKFNAGESETVDIVFSRPANYEYEAHIDLRNNDLRVYCYDKSGNYSVNMLYGLDSGQLVLKDNTSVNPKMVIGTEYKLAESYNGDPVYAKLINFGTLPNNTYKSLSVGVTPDKFVSVLGFAYNSADKAFLTFPTYHGGEVGATFFTNGSGDVVVETFRDMSPFSAVFLLKYTK